MIFIKREFLTFLDVVERNHTRQNVAVFELADSKEASHSLGFTMLAHAAYFMLNKMKLGITFVFYNCKPVKVDYS